MFAFIVFLVLIAIVFFTYYWHIPIKSDDTSITVNNQDGETFTDDDLFQFYYREDWSDFQDVDDFVKVMRRGNRYLEFRPMSYVLEKKACVALPQVSEQDSFYAARFFGRLLGCCAAALNVPRKICIWGDGYYVKSGTMRTAFNINEKKAVDALMHKIMCTNNGSFSFEAFTLGLWEGTAVVSHDENLSVLCTETNIDVNKRASKRNDMKAESSSILGETMNTFAIWANSAFEILQILQTEEGSDISFANVLLCNVTCWNGCSVPTNKLLLRFELGMEN